jgi:2-(1,2-epoxy-1,2-dihydrophenyl)acetyl-CoA isomerase
MTDEEPLHLEQREGVRVISFHRPPANAFTIEMVTALRDMLRDAALDDAVRCIVLTGSEGYFSTGHDVREITERGDPGSYRHHLRRTYNRVVEQMRALEKPIIGGINGPAVGAGLGIALATDMRLASERAQFRFGFTGIGLTADSGISLSLPLLVGMSRALEMAFLNQPLSAEDALDWGLVSRVVPDDDLTEVVLELASALADGPTRAFGLTKRAFNHAMHPLLQDALNYEAYLQEIASRTQDHREGLAAFAEKRPPQFRGN